MKRYISNFLLNFFPLRLGERVRVRGKGITLLEILVVMAIIAVLSAIATPALGNARRRAMSVKTESVIASIEAALSMYGTDFGDYPAFEGEGTGSLTELLQGPVESRFWKGPYMRFKTADIDGGNNILDAWKTPLSYRYPQDGHTNVPYIIISAGPDREMGTADDIGNW
ncbi:MAG: type II secretion system protein GspG [Candidatus Omnitrophica bacterium]|nr:type II secretion system protein GspG [Candidatus Omnitrophota bacterium]